LRTTFPIDSVDSSRNRHKGPKMPPAAATNDPETRGHATGWEYFGEKLLPPTTGTPLARHSSEFSWSGEDANQQESELRFHGAAVAVNARGRDIEALA
jgi:hypothetical protein